ncbi:MAG: carbohydrate-binding family 9-like protein [Agriterribacter sp.]
MKLYCLTICLFLTTQLIAQQTQPLLVKRCADFEVTGKGDNKAWEKTDWVQLRQLDEGPNYESKFKILYSATGIYVLLYGEDKKITSPYQKDFDALFKADVFEVFFHPQPATPLYIEYEVSPLDKELVLLIPNLKGKAGGWIPWHYEGNKKTRKAVFTQGSRQDGQPNSQWSAEIFFPYPLLHPLENVPPLSGTVWNANFYRLDYDSGKMIKWSWMPVKQSFHEFEKFGSIQFE